MQSIIVEFVAELDGLPRTQARTSDNNGNRKCQLTCVERFVEMNERKQIIITQDMLKDLVFKGVSFDVEKTSTIDGKKVEITYKVAWNGVLGETALKQASMHQSKNWYNNHRPIFDKDGKVQTVEEYASRKAMFLKLDGQVNPIDAVAQAVRLGKAPETLLSMVENAKRCRAEGKDDLADAYMDKYHEAVAKRNADADLAAEALKAVK